jgi:hypothetical protein
MLRDVSERSNLFEQPRSFIKKGSLGTGNGIQRKVQHCGSGSRAGSKVWDAKVMRATSLETKVGTLVPNSKRRIAYLGVNLELEYEGAMNACLALTIDASRPNSHHKDPLASPFERLCP